MPPVSIDVIKSVPMPAQKADMIFWVTDQMVAVKVEELRDLTRVRLLAIEQGDWTIGGKLSVANDMLALAKPGAERAA